jgi:glycosyltransferase involved in cell wall biosynthesis
MQNVPTISVVIPCYNAERYIVATIDSVLAQDQPGLEIIVVDDGSSDRSVELIRATFPQVRVEQQANQGVAAARNNGIRLATGEWIAFVDADDIWLPGKLAAQLEQLAANPGCRLNYCAWQVWASDAPLPAPAFLAELTSRAGERAQWDGPSGWVYPDLLLDCVVWTSTVLAQRSLFDEVGVFDTTLRLGEDYDLWLRISRVTTILRVARPYALYRIHPASITRTRPTDNYRATVIGRALAQWGMESPDGRQADPKAVRRMLAKTWTEFADAQLRAGDTGFARRGCWKALRTLPFHVPGWKVLIKACIKTLAGPSIKESV